MHKLFALGVLAFGLGSGSAYAQSTLGDLLDAGGVKLSKQEVLDAIRGATVDGTTPAGGNSLIEYKPDGTYSGSYQGRPGTRGVAKEGGLLGKWTVGENGRLCTEGFGRGGKETDRCFFLYRLGDRYYETAATPAKRSAVVHLRTIKR